MTDGQGQVGQTGQPDQPDLPGPGRCTAWAEAQALQQTGAVRRGRISWKGWKISAGLVALGLLAQGFVLAAPPSPSSSSLPSPSKPPPASASVVLSCAVAYMPQRSTWVREVRIDWDKKAIRRLRIDGLEPYGFTLIPNGLMTAIDNERIQIDLKAQLWTSDFRGLAAGQGRCEPVPG